MARKVLIRPLIINRRNNQISINIPRKLTIFKTKDKMPKKVKIKLEEIIW